jgi:hypothetical protein
MTPLVPPRIVTGRLRSELTMTSSSSERGRPVRSWRLNCPRPARKCSSSSPEALTVRRVIVSGDIALLISDWTLTGKAADGSDVNMSGTTADVARRGPDGWKYVIDNPFGTV